MYLEQIGVSNDTLLSITKEIEKITFGAKITGAGDGGCIIAREFLIKNNREVIINCSQAIIAIHKNDLGSAKLKIKKAKLLLAKLKQKSTGDLKSF